MFDARRTGSRPAVVIMHSYRELASAALGVLPLGAEEESPAISSIEVRRPPTGWGGVT